MQRISLYWKNATAEAVGEKHGVSEKELKAIAPRIKAIHQDMITQRKAGKLRYRDLPYDDDMMSAVHKEVEHFRDRCDVLIVLGIGGSALGNIALQSALNPYTYNLLTDRTRQGPQLFVLDNVDPDQIRSVVDLITPRIKRTIIDVISKSGETAETASQFILFRDLLQQKLGKKFRDKVYNPCWLQGSAACGGAVVLPLLPVQITRLWPSWPPFCGMLLPFGPL